MKKSVQVELNCKALERWEKAMSELAKNALWSKCMALYSCQASIIETENYYILRSYKTVIACYNKKSIEFTDMLRYVYGYTSTSAQHIAKFRNWIRYRENIGWCDMHELRYYPV